MEAWFIHSIIRHIQLSSLPLEQRCLDNRGSTVVYYTRTCTVPVSEVELGVIDSGKCEPYKWETLS